MAGKTKPGKPVKGINIKLKMINDLMDVTGSAKDSWNPAEISDDMKAIAYIHDLADTWNPAQLNEALKYLGFATIDSWNPAIIEETKNKLVKYFLPTNASGNPIELDLKGALPYEVTALAIDLLPIQDLSHGEPSPTNICPISGRNSVTLTVNGEDTEITLPQTVYKGNVNVVEGGATSTYKAIDLGDMTFAHRTDGSSVNPNYFLVTPKQTDHKPVADNDINYICSCYKSAKYYDFNRENLDGSIFFSGAYNNLVIIDTRYTDATSIKAALAGQTLCYELATPDELTTSAEEVTLVNGENTLSTDGDTINITYKAILNS